MLQKTTKNKPATTGPTGKKLPDQNTEAQIKQHHQTIYLHPQSSLVFPSKITILKANTENIKIPFLKRPLYFNTTLSLRFIYLLVWIHFAANLKIHLWRYRETIQKDFG